MRGIKKSDKKWLGAISTVQYYQFNNLCFFCVLAGWEYNKAIKVKKKTTKNRLTISYWMDSWK